MKKKFKEAIDRIAEDYTIGEAKIGDLAGIYCYDVYYNNEKIGQVTSGGISPIRGENIGLAYIKNLDNLSVGSTIQIMVREKLHDAEIVKRPFVKKNNKWGIVQISLTFELFNLID